MKTSYHLAAALLLGGAASVWAAAARPNIVLILSDDSGYTDLGCFGGEIDTPNLDRLAERGMRLSSFYSNGRCSPTRASLLSGLDCARVGFGGGTLGDWSRPRWAGHFICRLQSPRVPPPKPTRAQSRPLKREARVGLQRPLE